MCVGYPLVLLSIFAENLLLNELITGCSIEFFFFFFKTSYFEQHLVVSRVFVVGEIEMHCI